MTQEFFTNSPKETEDLAAKLAEKLTGGEVIAFTGGMGVGKTAFTRGIVMGLGAGDVASSPTFALVNEYIGRLTVQHFDMYRIDTWDALYSTGFFDYLDTESVIVIEWSENIESVLPENAIYVHICQGNDENERKITVEGLKGRL